jgi:ceramide glucosyltransferase
VSATAVNAYLARNEKLWRFLWVVLVQELLRLPLVLSSLFNNDIVWRGRRFRVHPDGMASIVGTRTVDRSA